MWVGWVTPDHHQHDMNFDLSKVRVMSSDHGDEQGNIHSRCGQGWGCGGRHAGLALSFPPLIPFIFLPMAPTLSFSLLLFFLFLVNFGCSGSSLQCAKLSWVAVCGLVCPTVCGIFSSPDQGSGHNTSSGFLTTGP